MNKIAAIDLGTNSMRLLLCEIEKGAFTKKIKEMLTTRIGEDLAQSGYMSEKAMRKNIKAIKVFQKKSEYFGAKEIFIIATSAVRDSINKEDFIYKVKNEVGLDIKVLDGYEEALIGMLGATHGLTDTKNTLIMDVGGGSTEIVLSKNKKISYSVSKNAGAVRMTEEYVKNNPIADLDIKNTRKALEKLFNDVANKLSDEKPDKVIAIGGTATTIAAMFHKMEVYNPEKIHNTILNMDYINAMFEKLRSMNMKDRYNIKGLEKERADIIPMGIYIIKFLMTMLSVKEITVSENDNLEGVVIKYSGYFV